MVVEAIVASALEPEWRWCSEDYSSWDFERSDGTKLEVKQSSARQSWATDKPSACSFDIAHRAGRYEAGTQWIDAPGRNAQVYVFAYHPIFDETADHRDASQWEFYVLPTSQLPDTKQISLSSVQALAEANAFAGLRQAVAVATQAP